MTRAVALVLFSLVAMGMSSAPARGQAAAEKKMAVEDIFAHGPMLGHEPDQLQWSPDGKHLTYMESGALLEIDSVTGKTHVMVSRSKMTPLDEPGGTEQDRSRRQP